MTSQSTVDKFGRDARVAAHPIPRGLKPAEAPAIGEVCRGMVNLQAAGGSPATGV